MTGGADCAIVVPGDNEILSHQLRFVATPSVCKNDIILKGLKELLMIHDTSNVLPIPVNKAGMLNPIFRAAEQINIPMIGIILFTKEGVNAPEAHLLAEAANLLTEAIPSPVPISVPASNDPL